MTYISSSVVYCLNILQPRLIQSDPLRPFRPYYSDDIIFFFSNEYQPFFIVNYEVGNFFLMLMYFKRITYKLSIVLI